VHLTAAELFDRLLDEGERLTGPAAEGIGSPEGRSNDRRPDDDLPRSAELEVPLELPGRTREIPAMEVSEAETVQRVVQRPRIARRFLSDLHGGLGVCDGLVEPTELGEHVGEPAPRDRRLDPGYREALVAQVYLDPDGRLEQGHRVVERAPNDVRHGQRQRCYDFERAIAEGARDTAGLPPESGRLLIVTSNQARDPHEVDDPPEPLLVAEPPGEHLRVREVLSHGPALPYQLEDLDGLAESLDRHWVARRPSPPPAEDDLDEDRERVAAQRSVEGELVA
jgi:hypothetical protein